VIVKRASNPDTVARGKGLFSQMYEVENATVSKTVFISGQVAWDAEGNVVGAGDLHAQFVQTYENLRSLMAGAGGGLDDIVQLRTNTLLIVNGLADPDLLLEVEGIAVL
jgi:enamine deaminase RidA (YjgF/YER057c/UK114 family)